jgi:LacI family transcriptional regulator
MDGEPPPKKPLWIEPAELAARQSTDVFAASDPVVAQAMRFIAENGHTAIRVGDVANHVHVGRRTLERRFRSTLGRTVSGEIARLRIERVKRRLVEGNARLKKLAAELGFRDEKRLCEAFRRLEGTTPGEYRRRHRHPAKP